MAMPGAKYADRIPPNEAERGHLEGKLLCSGSPGCPDLVPQSRRGTRCADRSWGEFGSTGMGSHSQPAGAPGEGPLLRVAVRKGKRWGSGLFFLPCLPFSRQCPQGNASSLQSRAAGTVIRLPAG